MSKIICDICGTSYPESAKQCPICGCVRPGDVQRVTNEVKSDGKVSTGYTYVKGGRFSKSNVKKRSQNPSGSAAGGKSAAPKNNENEENKTNRGLVITAIVLLLAIIGVVVYGALRIFAPVSGQPDNTQGNTQGTVLEIACTDLTLDSDSVLFEQIGVAKLLDVKTVPANATDTVTFRSENEEIATITDKGKITAVAEGTTKIIITCGNVTKECVVTIQFPEETTLPTIEDTTGDTEDTTVPDESTPTNEELRLNRKDITFSYKGESWVLYSGGIAKNLIIWSSDDENIVTFVDGKAVAVGRGMTEVHAEYAGAKVSCVIRCNFTDSAGVVGNGGVSEDGGGSTGNGGVSEDGGASSGVITGYCNCQVSINIRSGPGTSFADVGDLFANEKVTVTETKQGSDGYTWGKIGENKWVAMNYIKTN
ncbi:MAG: hypothetical protein E7421_01510 [Ruminococcaceae bacterium]|nr:hypothetical protein [Oscillospiraceae bacterium]